MEGFDWLSNLLSISFFYFLVYLTDGLPKEKQNRQTFSFLCVLIPRRFSSFSFLNCFPSTLDAWDWRRRRRCEIIGSEHMHTNIHINKEEIFLFRNGSIGYCFPLHLRQRERRKQNRGMTNSFTLVFLLLSLSFLRDSIDQLLLRRKMLSSVHISAQREISSAQNKQNRLAMNAIDQANTWVRCIMTDQRHEQVTVRLWYVNSGWFIRKK